MSRARTRNLTRDASDHYLYYFEGLNPKMPPRKTPRAPENRVYKSSIPLQQTRFTVKTMRIRSYGKQTTKRLPRQETLTQMDFVNLQRPLNEDDEELGIYDSESEKRKKRRRKTVGDQPSADLNYHTQTITQLDWSFTSVPEEEDGPNDIPSSSPRPMKLRHKNAVKDTKLDCPVTNGVARRKSTTCSMGPPQTPRRMHAQEIPSSQSPATPPSRDSPLKPFSPTRNSISIPIQFSTPRQPHSSPTKSPKLEIGHTFDTAEDVSQQTRSLPTPLKPSSPAKSVRFAIPDEVPEDSGPTPVIKREQLQFSASHKSSSQPNLRFEIQDSDAESDEDYEEQQTKKSEADHEVQLQPETCYGQFGLETQIKAEQLLASSYVEESQELGQGLQGELFEGQSQFMESQRLSTQQLDYMAARTNNSDIFISIHPQHVTNILNGTKNHEFRRWLIPPTVSRIWIYETHPVSTLKYMAVIGSAKRAGETLHERGVGNAEFNAKPVGSLEYAYEILELYELADPLSRDRILSNEWLNAMPQKFAWVRPAVLDHLMANLKPRLSCSVISTQEAPMSSPSDTQEAEAQLLSTMIQFTQQGSSTKLAPGQINNADSKMDKVLSHSRQQATSRGTQNLLAQQESPRSEPNLPHPSQASTVDLTQSETPRKQSAIDIVWESPTRPVLSSTPINLPTPSAHRSVDPESRRHFSLSSSQLLTKSQMLPESLLNESVPGPPLFIEDSDEDD